MICPKCNGLVVQEWVPEALPEAREAQYQLRCLNCGWLAPAPDTLRREQSLNRGLEAGR